MCFIRQRVGSCWESMRTTADGSQVGWHGLWRLVVLESGRKTLEAWGMAEGKSMMEGIKIRECLEGREADLDGDLRYSGCCSRVFTFQPKRAFCGHHQRSERASAITRWRGTSGTNCCFPFRESSRLGLSGSFRLQAGPLLFPWTRG